MAFDPGAEYLLCVTADATIFIVPAYELVVGSMLTGDTTPSLTEYALHGGTARRHVHLFRGPTKDVECVPIGKTGAHSKPICCVWWMSRQGSHYAIVGFDGGEVVVVDLEQKSSVRSFRLKQAVIGVELVSDPLGSATWAIIHGEGKRSWKLLLEQQREDSMFETLVSHPSDKQYSIAPLAQFPPGCRLSTQETAQGVTIAVQHPEAKIEVFDCELSKYAMFVFQICPGMELVHMSDKFLFTVSGPPEAPEGRNRLSVISRLLAGTSGGSGPVHHPREAIMQEFRLPPGQRLQGVLQTRPPLVSVAAAPPDSPDSRGKGSVRGGSTPPLYLWSQDTIYECAMDMRPEEIFKSLVMGGLERNHAEPLGKTLGLDLLLLYKEVADEYFEAGQHERALSIYFLSNVDPGELAQKFLSVGRMDVAILHLRQVLHLRNTIRSREEEEIPPGPVRDHLNSLLLQAHIHRIMEGNAKDLPAIRLATERLCQSGVGDSARPPRRVVMELLQNAGLFKELVMVGEADGAIRDVLDIALQSSVQLPSSCIQQLIDSNNGLVLQHHSIFDHLSRKHQNRIFLDNIWRDTVIVVPRLYDALAYLDREDLIQVAETVDPHGVNSAPLAALGAPDAALEMGSGDKMGSEEMGYTLTELYLAAFLHINAVEAVEEEAATTRHQDQSRHGGGRWGQTALRAALWSHFGHYRADRMIPYCLDLENDSAAAGVYEMLSYWPEAISCHLKAYAVLFVERKGGWESEEALEAMTPLLSPLLKASVDSGGKVFSLRPMVQVLNFWKDKSLPTPTLEEFLIQHSGVLGPIMGALAVVHEEQAREGDDVQTSGNQGEWSEAEDGGATRMLELEEVMEEAMGMAAAAVVQEEDTDRMMPAAATHTAAMKQPPIPSVEQEKDEDTDLGGASSSSEHQSSYWHFPAWVHKFSTRLHLAVAASELKSIDRREQEAHFEGKAFGPLFPNPA